MTCPRLPNPEAMNLRFSLTSDSRPLFILLDYLIVVQAQTSTIPLTPLSSSYTPHHVQQQILGALPSKSNYCYHLHCCYPDLSHHFSCLESCNCLLTVLPAFAFVILSSVFYTGAKINLLKHKIIT